MYLTFLFIWSESQRSIRRKSLNQDGFYQVGEIRGVRGDYAIVISHNSDNDTSRWCVREKRILGQQRLRSWCHVVLLDMETLAAVNWLSSLTSGASTMFRVHRLS